ncbi:MAG: hypothetical protein AAFV26_10325 [Pseudomonadota bacterium]
MARRNSFGAAAAALRFALVGAASLALAGCLDLDMKLELKPDGQTRIGAAVFLEEEAVDVAKMIEAAMALQPQTTIFASNGVCKAAEFAAALNPALPLKLTAQQGLEDTPDGKRFACRFNAEAGQVDDVVGLISSNPLVALSTPFLSIEKQGDRRVRVAFKPSLVPDPKQSIQLVLGLLLVRTGSGAPDPQALQAVLNAYGPATVALNEIVARGKRISFRITAPKIIETNMPRDGDDIYVSATWAQYTKFSNAAPTMDPGLSYYAILEY